MEEKYDYLFVKYLYDKLNLNESEKKFDEKGVLPYYSDLTENKFFCILNDGNLEKLSEDEKKKLELFGLMNYSDIMKNESLKNELYSFLETTYKKFYFDESEEITYNYYGPTDFEYMAPSDAIVLGFDYRKTVPEKDGIPYDTLLEENDKTVCDELNHIQDSAEGLGLKVAVIRRDEFLINSPSVIL